MKFFTRATILVIVLFVLTYFLQRIPAFNFINTFVYSSLAFFYLLTLLIIGIIAGAMKRTNNRQFVSMITAAIGIKIFASIIFVLVYCIINKPTSILIIVPFFFYYALFTIIEVAEMLRLNAKAAPPKSSP